MTDDVHKPPTTDTLQQSQPTTPVKSCTSEAPETTAPNDPATKPAASPSSPAPLVTAPPPIPDRATTKFQKGRSGNPKGRPKGSRNFNTDTDEMLDSGVGFTSPDGKRRKVTTQKAALLRLKKRALVDDNTPALRELLARAERRQDQRDARAALTERRALDETERQRFADALPRLMAKFGKNPGET